MPLNRMALGREVGESVVLRDAATGDILATVTVERGGRQRVRLLFEADRRKVLVDRREVYLAKRNEESVTEAIRVAAAQA